MGPEADDRILVQTDTGGGGHRTEISKGGNDGTDIRY